jgi:hypothetical protein
MIPKETLIKEYCNTDLRIQEVADKIGVTYKKIKYWLVKYELSIKQLNRRQYSNKNSSWRKDITKESLVDLHINKKWSVNKISKHFNTDEKVINSRFELFNIKKLPLEIISKEAHKHQIKKGSRTRNRKEYIQLAKQNRNWICEICGKKKTNETFDLIVHHVDRNNKNNNVSNLMVLCQNCHAREHFTRK